MGVKMQIKANFIFRTRYILWCYYEITGASLWYPSKMSPSGLTCRPKCEFIYFSPHSFPCCHSQREQRKQQRRRQQTEPAVPAGWRQVSHVQLGGRVLSAAKPRPELSAFAPGQHEPPRRLRLLHDRLGGSTAGAQHARTPAPTAGLLVGTSNLQSCGFGLLKGC